MAVVITQYLLQYLRPLSICIVLQEVDCDLVKVHYQCLKSVETLNEVRDEADEAFDGLYIERATEWRMQMNSNLKTQNC